MSEHYGVTFVSLVDYDIVVIGHFFDCHAFLREFGVMWWVFKVGDVSVHGIKGIFDGFGTQSRFQRGGYSCGGESEEVWFTISLVGVGVCEEVDFTLGVK